MAFVTDTGLAATGTGQGANMVGFIQAGTDAVMRTTMAKLRDTVSVCDFGAAGDGVTNDTAAFNAALEYAESANVGLALNGLTYVLDSNAEPSGGVNFARTGLVIEGGGASLQFIGAGQAFVLDQGGDFGEFLEGMSVSDITIIGNDNTLDGFYSRGVVRSVFRNISVLNVGGKAFWIKHGVTNQYDSLKYSALPAGQPRPTVFATHGLYLDNNDGPGKTGYYSADCTFINPIMENFPGVACELADASGCIFTGGTFEGVTAVAEDGTGTGIGIVISSTSRHNEFSSIWFEMNETCDIKCHGSANMFANLYLGSNSALFNVELYSNGNSFHGGFVRGVNKRLGTYGNSFHGVALPSHETVGLQGPGRFSCVGCTLVDNNLDPTAAVPDQIEPAKGAVTATLTASGGGTINLDPAFNKLYWTKTGNRVEYSGELYVASVTGTLSGELHLNGMTHAPAGVPGNRASGSITATDLLAGQGWQMMVDPGISYVLLQKIVTGGGGDMAADIKPGSGLRLSFSFATEL